jgi:DNA-binding NarL/FixJ family response regulator
MKKGWTTAGLKGTGAAVQDDRTFSILLVEDDGATRARLAGTVGRHPALCLFGEAGSYREALAELERGAPDVLLVDLGLPDGSGIDLIRELRQRSYATEAMVITVFGDEQHVVAAIEAGASGYLLKDGSAEYVCDSILELVRGGSPISPAIARHLLRRFRASPPAATPGTAPVSLTEREVEVLGLLVKGFTFHEIGELLEISAHTVTTHVRHIYGKLEVRSRAEAVYEAMQLGMVKDQRR